MADKTAVKPAPLGVGAMRSLFMEPAAGGGGGGGALPAVRLA